MTYTNPSVEEINEWAYSGAKWPVEEWDLFLSWTCEVELFIALATDHKCPHQSFFLHMLYYIVGTTYGEPRQEDPLSRIASYAEKGRAMKHGEIKKWVAQVDELLKGNKKYGYADWRGGKLAGYEFT
jgi:hypothetical protein